MKYPLELPDTCDNVQIVYSGSTDWGVVFEAEIVLIADDTSKFDDSVRDSLVFDETESAGPAGEVIDDDNKWALEASSDLVREKDDCAMEELSAYLEWKLEDTNSLVLAEVNLWLAGVVEKLFAGNDWSYLWEVYALATVALPVIWES